MQSLTCDYVQFGGKNVCKGRPALKNLHLGWTFEDSVISCDLDHRITPKQGLSFNCSEEPVLQVKRDLGDL